MRQLWIARINAAARMNGLSYNAALDLSELAVNDKEGFATLAAIAKEKVA